MAVKTFLTDFLIPCIQHILLQNRENQRRFFLKLKLSQNSQWQQSSLNQHKKVFITNSENNFLSAPHELQTSSVSPSLLSVSSWLLKTSSDQMLFIESSQFISSEPSVSPSFETLHSSPLKSRPHLAYQCHSLQLLTALLQSQLSLRLHLHLHLHHIMNLLLIFCYNCFFHLHAPPHILYAMFKS